MALQKFLNLLALMIGVGGVLMVSKAVFLEPKDILKTTYYYSYIGFPSKEFISNKVGPKADVAISVIAVTIAFIIQFASLVIVDSQTPFVDNKLYGTLLAFVSISVVFLVLFHIHKGIYSKNVSQIKCLEEINYLE